MRTKKSKTVPTGIFSLWILAVSIFVSSDAFASAIQAQSPANIFAASCSTCHGAKGQGGVTFVKDGVGDNRIAPRIAGKPARYVKAFVRAGSPGGAMPAFGREEITDAELNALANALQSDGTGTTLVPTPVGSPIVVNILDADPWFMDDNNDNDNSCPTCTGNDDRRRVDLDAGEYVKVVNTGRTWHTFTNSAVNKDSGFIGYAGNYRTTPGDLDQGVTAGIGYYYADQATGLAAGCEKYYCKLHPYMQVEVCTATDSPKGPTTSFGLTRAHKHPFDGNLDADTNPQTAGSGEVWVTTQSQEEVGEDTTTVSDESVNNGMDGTYQVINAGTWGVTRIPNVGNNPHNAWAGNDAAGNDVVLSADWHDNSVVLMDAAAKTVLNRRRSGASNAHVMTTPGLAERFYISHMGGRAIQEIDVNRLRLGFDPNTGGVIRGATGPHGLWMCDDGSHVLTADTFGASATLYNLGAKTSKSAGSGGKAPLAPAIMGGYSGGCARGFTNNALTADVSIYDISGDNISRNISPLGVTDPGGASIQNGAGNIALRNTTTDQTGPAPSAFMARWAHLPIQTPVSPADATTHGRFMVTANKASFNVSITALSSATGLPTGLYTFPAGLGAHGVTYGPKAFCDINNDGVEETAFGTILPDNSILPADADSNADVVRCYYSYVTDTFEDYVSVYDLEKIDDGTSMQGPGSALLAERVYVEGGAVETVAALDPVVASLCDVLELDANNDVDNTAIPDGDCNDHPGGVGNVGQIPPDVDLNADGICNRDNLDDVNGDAVTGSLVRPGLYLEDNGIGDATDVLNCGVGVMGGSLYVANLPIGVLCPDCRNGVHVGDVPLTLTTGAALGGTWTAFNTLSAPGTGAKYTYLKEEVYVDTETTACALEVNDEALGICDELPLGVGSNPNTYCGIDINDCDGNTLFRGVPETDTAGRINAFVTLDLDLGINTGGQGIMGRDPSDGKAPVLPW